MIASDVHGLRKGMDLIKFEKEKQPFNQTIAVSFTSCMTPIASANTGHQ